MRAHTVLLGTILGFSLSILPAAAAAPATPQVRALQAQGHTVAAHRRTGHAVFVGTADAGPLPAQAFGAVAATPAADAPRAFLDALGPAFGLARPARDTQLIRDRTDDVGHRSTRYRQLHQGLPVIAGEVIVNTDVKGRLRSMTGRAAPELAVGTRPSVSAAEAQAIAIARVAKHHAVAEGSLIAREPELSVYDPRLVDGADALPPGLVWRVEVVPTGLAPIDEYVLVDAVRGHVRLAFNQVHHARNRNTYDKASVVSTTLPGTLICDEANDACTGGAADAIAAHVHARDTYDYYLAQHGRDSIDGAGMELRSTVRYCPSAAQCPYRNAFWTSAANQMVYGAGYPAADDVVAHELTHGVTRRESNLFYYYQSGAINESLSDVFGEIVDQSNGRGNDAAGVKWLMGEDIGAIRSMADPTVFGDPDRMTSTFYYRGASDGGGVHTNSGVNNKAAYLMSEGGTFNGRTVAGVGLAKVGKIYYRVQTQYLVSASDYLDLYNALYQACIDLVGTSGITVADCKSVRAATDAVEMNMEPILGFNTDAASCPAGQAIATVLFAESFEGALGVGFTSSRVGSAYNWQLTKDYATSGVLSAWGPEPGTVTDLSMVQSAPVVIVAGTQLRFRHAYDFEFGSSYYDGAVLEYTADGGATWSDANGLRVAGPGYGGVLSSAFSNPLGGRSAFVGASHGFVATRYDLSPLAGQAVRFRWRIGSDSSTSGFGWQVDDISIHICAPSPDLAFTNAATTTFRVNTFGAFALSATGAPAPAFTVSGPLPAGVLFSVQTFVGTPAPGSAGTYPLIIRASNGAMPDVYQDFTLVVGKRAQAIAFGSQPSIRQIELGPFAWPVTGGASGNAVQLSSLTPASCSASGNTVTPTAPGTCTVQATQAGNDDFDAAPPLTDSLALRFGEPKPRRVDFNADSKADILWLNTAGRTAEWLMNGATQVGGRELFGAGTGWRPILVADMNGDHKADILFEHDDGSSAMWLMNGDIQIGGARLLTAGTGWKAKLLADFNGDGRADIVWEHADGRVAMWLMNGTTMIGGGVLLPAGTGWHPKFAADFDNDGKLDILWEHNDQASALWLMNGLTQVGGGRLFPGGSGWLSVATPDLNGDRKADILWRHADGRVATWIMNGSAQVGGAVILAAGTGYTPVATGDVNGDQRDDVVFQHADGSAYVQPMNGATVGGGTIPMFPAGTWVLKRFVDFNADGRADWVAVQASDGAVSMGVFNGTVFNVTPLLAGGTGYVPLSVPD